MATKKRKGNSQHSWAELNQTFKTLIPQLHALWSAEDDFKEIRLTLRVDGTVLAIVKKHGEDGGPLVCFGSGYGIAGSLMAAEGTIAANGWKVDKPWSAKS